MAVTLTATNSAKVQVELARMFPGDTQHKNQYMTETPISSSLFAKQSMRVQPIMENGICTGWEAWFPDLTDLDTALGTISSTAPVAANCHLTACPTVGSLKIPYNNNMFTDECASVSDDDCGNDYKFIDRMADSLAQLIKRMDDKIEKHIAATLFANVSAPVSGDPNSSAGYLVGATSIDVSAANWTLDILPKLMTTAQFNKMGKNLVFAESGSLSAQLFAAPFLSLNDDQRSLGAFANQFRDIITVDTHNLFGVLGAHGGLLVNADQFGFFNQTQFQNLTVAGDVPLSQVAGFKVRSPRLAYRRNTIGADGRRSNALAPVEYDVLYEKVCNASNSALGWTTYSHTLKVRLTGGFVSAPAATNGTANETGVIHLKKV